MHAAISLDLGSTSIKAGLLGREGELSHVVSQPVPAITPDGGRYESNAVDYAKVAESVLAECLSKTNEPPPLGVCSQRSSFLIWDANNGQPITPLISWQDTRGAASCDALRANEPLIFSRTGLRLTPYYFAPKLRVLLQAFPQWLEKLKCREYLVGTLDTYLIWRWTGCKHFVTDASMAARTLLMDIHRRQWSAELCEIFGIPLNILPQIIPSTGLAIRLDNGLILQASMGDQSAAFFASVGSECNAALVNLGTGGFVMRDVTRQENVNQAKSGYLRTLLYQDSTANLHIACEGTLNSIAAALADYPVTECQIDDLATNDIFCLSEPSGVGAPYFRSDLGVQYSHSIDNLSRRQVAALLLEGIIFRVARILEDFHRESAIEPVYLSGGLSGLIFLQQGLAQCLPMRLYRLQEKDASLLGAGLLAAGMHVSGRALEPIVIAGDASRLIIKYQRWKIWFDDLLSRNSG